MKFLYKKISKALLAAFPVICCACSSPPEPPMPSGPKIAVNLPNSQSVLVHDFDEKETPKKIRKYTKF